MRVSSDGQAVFDIFKNTITITSRNTTIKKERNEKEPAGWLCNIEEVGSISVSGETYFPSLRQYQYQTNKQHSCLYQHRQL